MKKIYSKYEKLLIPLQRKNREIWQRLDKKISQNSFIELSLREFLIYWETLDEHIKKEYLLRIYPYKSKVGRKLIETIYFKGYPILIKQ